MRQARPFTILYAFLLITHLTMAELQEAYPAMSVLVMVTKPTLVLALIIWIALALRSEGPSAFSTWILFGLGFSLGGDVLLMFQSIDDRYFIMGLASFFAAHVCYIGAFTRTYRSDHEVALLRKHGWLLLLVVGYAVVFFQQISSFLGGMMFPVMLYTLVITVMVLVALSRHGKVGAHSFWYVVIGAVFFLASDSILAWNKFVHQLDHSHLLIMGTYGLAQFYISLGARYQMADTGRRAREH